MASTKATKAAGSKRRFRVNEDTIPTISAVVIFILMLLGGQALFGTYLRLGTISDLFIDHAYLIILAVAMTFPILTGGIDLSVGAIVALSGITGAQMLGAGMPVPVVLVAMLAIGALSGLVAATLIEEFNMQPFIATLATQFLCRGIASIITTQSLSFPKEGGIRFLATKFLLIDNNKVSNNLTITPGVIIALIVVLFGFFMLHRTRFGRTVYAIGGSKPSAQLMGLPVKRSQYLIYIISGTLAAVAGIVYAAKMGAVKANVGVGWELDAVAAVVIGGTIITGGHGFVLGSVVGALVRSLLDPLTTDFGVPAEAVTIVVGVMILAFVLLQKVVTVVSEKRNKANMESVAEQVQPE